jgi:hypothetical protein
MQRCSWKASAVEEYRPTRSRRTGRAVRIAALVVLAVGSTTALVSKHAAARPSLVSDPPRIIPWHQIGNVGLGMSRARIESLYGTPSYDGPEGLQFKVPGGILAVNLAGPRDKVGQRLRGNVVGIWTTSRRYRTRGGLGVGSRIPFAPCRGPANKRCVRVWRGFRLGTDPATGTPSWWLNTTYRGRPVTAVLYVGKGVVSQVSILRGRLRPDPIRGS